MKLDECIIEQYRGSKLLRSFEPSDDSSYPWRMHVNGKSYLKSHGWVLSKVLPTLVDGSHIASRVVAITAKSSLKTETVFKLF
jgi:hypothetical protein